MKEKPTVIIYSTAYLPLIGGAELAIKEITDRMGDFNFFLITARINRSFPRRERMGNVTVFRFGVGIPLVDKLYSIPAGMWTARRLIRNYRPVLFWSVMVSFTSLVPFLLRFFRLHKGVPILLTLQEGDSPEHIQHSRSGLIGRMWRFALTHANHVQVISSYLDGMARRYGYAGDITLVPNGIDINTYKVPSTKFKESERSRNTIITVSRLVTKNGVDVLIRAFAEVRKKFPHAELHIVGDGPLRTELEARARILDVADAVKFFGAVPNDTVNEYLMRADIFARPSRSEGLGISFLEAMAAGLPVIATPVGGISDFLQNGETGLFCNVDDPQDLAEKITTLFENKELGMRISENGRTLVEEQYTWDGVAAKMKTIFNVLTR